jgi:putative thioredoxin
MIEEKSDEMILNPHLILITNEAHFISSVQKASHNLPILFFFYANWCKPSQIIRPVLEDIVYDFKGKFNLAVLDTDLPDLENIKK